MVWNFQTHVGINRISIREHPLVSQAVETVATNAQVPVTFDIVPVLAYVQTLHTASIFLHLLSSIALFLTDHSSISRVSCGAHLGSPLLEQRDSVVLYFVSLEEQGESWEYMGLPPDSGFS